jgi:hypothetical protein
VSLGAGPALARAVALHGAVGRGRVGQQARLAVTFA